jgi:hypothetical protein
MDDTEKAAMDAWMKGADKTIRDFKMRTLKRWGQKDCERCGGPLETLFDSNGKNPIRICIPCEDAANDHID